MAAPNQHRDQRVGVFVDVSNMYYSARQLYQRKINFTELLKHAVAGRKLVRAFAYAIKTDVAAEPKFHEALQRVGFDVRLKDLQIFFGGAKKGDWDVGIAMDIVRFIPKLDVIVLVSGDGDFKDLLEYASSMGCRTEVISFEKTTSSRIIETADLVTFMDKDLKTFLWSSTERSMPGQSRPPARKPASGRGPPRKQAPPPRRQPSVKKQPPLGKSPPAKKQLQKKPVAKGPLS